MTQMPPLLYQLYNDYITLYVRVHILYNDYITLYVRVHILLTGWKHFHEPII
jgi:hypothetical protein